MTKYHILGETNDPEIHDVPQTVPSQSLFLKSLAYLFSVLFHPLLIPMYVTLFLIYLHPSYFAGFGKSEKIQVLLIVLLNVIFFPLFTVFLLKGLGLIDSLYLKSQKDRIIPYIASSIFFFWACRVFLQQPQYPLIIGAFMLGVLLASFIALFANIYYKISMHGIGMGGLLGILTEIMKSHTMLMTWPFCISILLTGIVCSSRLLLSDHIQKEIYTGLLVGFICQLIAGLILV